MEKNGTASKMTTRQFREFAGAVLRSLPDDLDPTTAQLFIEDQDLLRKRLERALVPLEGKLIMGGEQEMKLEAQTFKPASPADHEIFSLTITKPFTGLEMVRDDGFKDWRLWKFTGKEIATPQTKRFKLVLIGEQPNFEAVVRELKKHGRIPQGQWRKAFKEAFPETDGSLIGVADSSWVSPSGGVHFPCVAGYGNEYFGWTGRGFGDDWRWLVEVA